MFEDVILRCSAVYRALISDCIGMKSSGSITTTGIPQHPATDMSVLPKLTAFGRDATPKTFTSRGTSPAQRACGARAHAGRRGAAHGALAVVVCR
jgi:hypothetical protein